MVDWAIEVRMDTGDVMSAPNQVQPEEAVQATRFLRARRWEYLRVCWTAAAFLAVAVVIGALFPKLRHLVWNALWTTVAIIVVEALKYLREFHASILPPILEYGAPLRVRLSRAKAVLGCTFWATIGLGFVANLLGICGREDTPVLVFAVVFVVVLAGSGLGFLGMAAYLGLRTANPRLRIGTVSYWPRAPLRISEYKPFVSEHWGKVHDL